MLKELFEFRETNRKWHLAVLAGICVGVPLLTGYFSDSLGDAKLASLAGLVILYIHEERTRDQMITLMICSFGIMLSLTVGVIFSFHPYWSALFLGVFAFGVHRALYLLGLHKPPGNFFFIMIASVAICLPFDIDSIPHKIGLVGLGTMSSCILGFVYSLLTAKDHRIESASAKTVKSRQSNVVESVTFGFFIGLGLLIARLLELDNPYWIPSSSAAVMQGISSKHIWQRSIQRVVGTFIGLIVTWLILRLHPTPFVICVSIVFLQIIVEMLVGRNYGVAVIFITVLTIFLAESGVTLTNPDALLRARFIDILIGSLVGAAGGWVLYNERVHAYATLHSRKRKVNI